MADIPSHLNHEFRLTIQPDFAVAPLQAGEVLIRRFNGTAEALGKGEFLSGIPSTYIDKGVSCNRMLYCNSENDVLWSYAESPPATKIDECKYSRSEGSIIYLYFDEIYLDATREKAAQQGLSVSLEVSPNPCNVSHVDLMVTPMLGSMKPAARNTARLFIATLFHNEPKN